VLPWNTFLDSPTFLSLQRFVYIVVLGGSSQYLACLPWNPYNLLKIHMARSAKDHYMENNHLSLFWICLPVVLFNGTQFLHRKKQVTSWCLSSFPLGIIHKGIRTVHSPPVWANQEFTQWKDDTICFVLHLPFIVFPIIQFALLTAAKLRAGCSMKRLTWESLV